MVDAPLPLATANFGFFYHLGLDESLRDIADAGYGLVELACGAPHVDLSNLGPSERRRLRRQFERNELECVSTNPIEMNPISVNRELFDANYRQYRAAIELAADLEAATVVMITGRRSPLIPVPETQAKDLLRAQLDRLLPVAQGLGVALTLEPVPFGFLQTASEVASFIQEFGIEDLGITVDCANIYYAGSDPAEELRAVAGLVKLVHISDSWRNRFAHTQVGRGEVDFEAFRDALRDVSYSGPTVYELVDGEDPAPRIRADRPRLSEWGWC